MATRLFATVRRRFALYRLLLVLLAALAAGIVGAQSGDTPVAPSGDGAVTASDTISGPVTAAVLGDELHLQNPEELRALILGRVLNGLVIDQQLDATEDEVFAAMSLLEHRMKAELGDNFKTLAEMPPAEMGAAMERRTGMASFLVSQWKLNKALFDEYGGRVVAQRLGPVPIDAQRAYLEERQAAGDFRIFDEILEAAFWAPFDRVDDSKLLTEEQGHKVFAAPPWEGS